MGRWSATPAVPVAMAVLGGVLVIQWLPALPPRWVLAALFISALWLVWRWPTTRYVGWFLTGAVWAAWWGAVAMDARLPHALEGKDLLVNGQIANLPQQRDDATRFHFIADQASLEGVTQAFRGRIVVSWYRTASTPRPCERWQLLLRVKRPRGLVNPGGADSERSALERRIVAVGYVREHPENRPLARSAWCIDGVRDAVARGIAERVEHPRDAALLQALSVGDTRGLSQEDWEVARANGISHLISISGFHVGVAAIFGVWLAMGGYAIWPRIGFHLPRPQVMAAAALLTACAYSALAGFGLPTVRTLLMIAVVATARCSRRATSGAQSLALALLVILLFDPLAVLSAGFWLSFVGVAFLMLCLRSSGRGLHAFLRELTAGQVVMTVALLPLTQWFFGEASLVGAVSNLIAVPLVSFVIVPLALLGTLLLGLFPPLAEPVFWVAATLSHGQWWLLQQTAQWPGAHWYLPGVSAWALALAVIGALWLFMPRGVPLRWLGMLLFLPLVAPHRSLPAEGDFDAWVLDVGQGLSVVVRTRDHTLLYDAGPRYPSGFDLGQAAVLPSLHALGTKWLDTLLISHGDNDHAGGAAAVLTAYPRARIFAGEPSRTPVRAERCAAGQQWRWNGVSFRVVWPSDEVAGHSNDRSCVVVVESRSGRLVLTGDISKRVEPLVAAALGQRPATVLLVPHHGSKTSSSNDFIVTVGPSLAVMSSGWRNRFGHPHPMVVQRYDQADIPWLNTAGSGAVALRFDAAGGPPVVSQWRHRSPRYWRE